MTQDRPEFYRKVLEAQGSILEAQRLPWITCAALWHQGPPERPDETPPVEEPPVEEPGVPAVAGRPCQPRMPEPAEAGERDRRLFRALNRRRTLKGDPPLTWEEAWADG